MIQSILTIHLRLSMLQPPTYMSKFNRHTKNHTGYQTQNIQEIWTQKIKGNNHGKGCWNTEKQVTERWAQLQSPQKNN